MKPKYITVDNYKQFKPSEFVRSFCADIDVAIKMKKPMDLNTFEYDPKNKCLPCLGGTACLNMGIPKKPDSFSFESNIQKYTSFIGDEIRLGNGIGIVLYLDKLYLTDIPQLSMRRRFIGILDKKDLRDLKQQVNEYADELESLGY